MKTTYLKIPENILFVLYRNLIYIILLIAFLLRFNGISYGLPFLYWPDEHPTLDALFMIKSRNLNPHWFGHPGSFLMYAILILLLVIIFIYTIICFLKGNIRSADDFSIISHFFYKNGPLFYFYSRLLNVTFAVISIYFVYLIAKKIFNKPVALLSALCLTLSPLHITHSRIIRPDVAGTMLILIALYSFLKFLENKTKTKHLTISSLFYGFAATAKYPFILFFIPAFIHCALSDFKNNKPQIKKYLINCLQLKTNLSRAIVFVFVGFFIFAPFVILDFKTAYKDVFHELRNYHFGHERLPGIQNYLWYIKNVFVKGAGGHLVALFSAIGLLVSTRKPSYKKHLLFTAPIVYFILFAGFANLRWARWMIPILPFESMLFGIGFYYVYKTLKNKKYFQTHKKILATLPILILAAIVYPNINTAVKSGTKLTRPDSRTIMKFWIETNLPEGSKIAYSVYAPKLHLLMPARKFNLMHTYWSPILSKPISYYQEKSIDFLIISSFFKSRYFAEPQKYSEEIARYKNLCERFELIRGYSNPNNPGPAIEIFKLK